MAIAAILFDMDGILIDSEPFWRRAEVEEFGAVGLKLTEDDCHQTTGLRIDEVVAFRHAQQPWSEPSQAEVAERITARVAELVATQGQPLGGARQALEAARQTGLQLGLASSSTYR
ncbi:MAG: HAD hydrolase-like protein, partial [Candidatus Eremiobacteraeota bacterium]|nr:HAD hydrolase-like protein [Candidatus Eremiobacteraeota bacterium]